VSLRTGREVTSTIWSRIGPTVLLVGLGTLLATVIGIWIGIKGGWRRGSAFDTSTLYGSLALYSIPEGWLGMLLLLVLSGMLGLFPAGGFETGGETGVARLVDVLDHLFLPLLTLTLGYVGQYAIIMRSSMIDVTHEDFVTSARAKGVPEHQVRRNHVVPNAFLPTFTLIFLNFGFVLGGAIVVEAVFSWPGLGLLTYDAINQLDYPMIQGVFLLSSAAVIVFNLVADITYGYLDPRVREA
jgi:peptide/nickel transport system permease protein